MTEDEKDIFIKFLNDMFKGKTVTRIRVHDTADEGILIEFNDGNELFVGYSSCEGSIQVRVK